MRHIALRSSFGLLFMVLAFAVGSGRAYSATTVWQDNQCWQTGQLGSESFACENASAPNFLATHMLDDLGGPEEQFHLAASDQ